AASIRARPVTRLAAVSTARPRNTTRRLRSTRRGVGGGRASGKVGAPAGTAKGGWGGAGAWSIAVADRCAAAGTCWRPVLVRAATLVAPRARANARPNPAADGNRAAGS